MRSMSFSLTTDQIRNRSKSVTRRLGWKNLKPGTLIRAVVKCMGLKKDEAMQPLAVLCVTSVRRERLDEIDNADVAREGFRSIGRSDFMRLFCEHNGCHPTEEVTRIEFRYVPGGRLE